MSNLSVPQTCEHCKDDKRNKRCRKFNSDERILCAKALSANQVDKGWRFIKLSSDGQTGVLAPDDGTQPSNIDRLIWQQKADDRKHEEAERRSKAMPPAERDEHYSKILSSLALHPADKQDLLGRGLDERQIESWGVKSVTQWQKLPFEIPVDLPGSGFYKQLANGSEGYLCPVRNVYRQIAAFQIRGRESSSRGRYSWLTSSTAKRPNGATAHDCNGELPLAVFRKHDRSDLVAICEGVGAKPFILSERFDLNVIGAAGGLFVTSPTALQTTLEELGAKTVRLYPDAGCIKNKQVASNNEKTIRFIQELGYQVEVAWWDQGDSKKNGDIDEIDPSQSASIEILSVERFLQIGKPVEANESESVIVAEPEEAISEKPKIEGIDLIDLIEPGQVEVNSETVFIKNLELAVGFQIRHCLNLASKFYVWNGKYHELLDEKELACKVQRWLDSIYSQKFNRNLGQWNFSRPFSSAGSTERCLAHLATLTAKSIDSFDPSALSLQDGVFKMMYVNGEAEPKLLDHSPEIICLKHCNFSFKEAMKTDTTNAKKLLEACSQPERLLDHLSTALDLPAIKKKHGRPKAGLLIGEGLNGKDSIKQIFGAALGGGIGGFTLSDFDSYDQGRRFNLSQLPLCRVSWGSENNHNLKLENLKALMTAISGDENGLYCEPKGVDAEAYTPNVLLFFNLNKSLLTSGAQTATKSRFAIYNFPYEFVSEADYDPKNPFQKIADTRYHDDPEWVATNVVPGFLRLLVEAFQRVYKNGFDWSFCDGELRGWAEKHSHLIQWTNETGIKEDPEGVLSISVAYELLKAWYIDNEYLKVDDHGSKRFSHPDDRYDKTVTRDRDLFARLKEFFPRIRLEVDKNGNVTGSRNRKYILGLAEPTKIESEPSTDPSEFLDDDEDFDFDVDIPLTKEDEFHIELAQLADTSSFMKPVAANGNGNGNGKLPTTISIDDRVKIVSMNAEGVVVDIDVDANGHHYLVEDASPKPTFTRWFEPDDIAPAAKV